MEIFFLFLVALALGCLSTLFWIPEDDLGRGYFQINALVVLGLLAIALVVALTRLPGLYGADRVAGLGGLAAGLVATVGYHASCGRERWRLARWAAGVAVATTAGALLLAGPGLIAPEAPPLPWRAPLLIAALLASALVLGWSLITMLLGHWYLVVPRLSFRHLVRFNRALLALVVARLALVAAATAAAASLEPAGGSRTFLLLVDLAGEGMFFWFRVLWGLAIPLVLAWMALDCAKRRANQSATGILYVLLVGTLIGEITGIYLTSATGVPM